VVDGLIKSCSISNEACYWISSN